VPGHAEPGRERERIVLLGDLPSPSQRIEGCRFHTRCPFAMDGCREVDPAVVRGARRIGRCVPPAHRRTWARRAIGA